MPAHWTVAIVCGLLVFGSLVVAAPRASADWCTSSFMVYSPTSGAPGTTVTFTFTFENMISATIQVSDFSVSFSWGGFSDFGVFVVGPYGTITGTSTETLPTTAGPESIVATVTGQANTDAFPISCYFDMPFTVTSTPPLSASASASPAATDVGLPVTFTCTASGGSSPYNYTWSFGDGTSAWGATASHRYAASGSMSGSCDVKDNAGGLASAPFTVLVHPAPTVMPAAVQLRAAPGTNVSFDAVASGGSGGFTYAWSFGDGASGSGANTTHAYTAPGNFTANVTATDSVGGTASATVRVAIARLVATASPSATSVAVGTNVSFTATAAGGAGGPYLFTWSFGDGTTGSGPSVTHAYATAGTYTAKVTVTDALGATNTTALASVTVQSGSPFTSMGLLPVLIIGVAVAAAAAGAAVLLLRRRGRAKAPPPLPPAPPPATPPPQP